MRVCSGVCETSRREDQSDHGRDQRSVQKDPIGRPKWTDQHALCGRSSACTEGKTNLTRLQQHEGHMCNNHSSDWTFRFQVLEVLLAAFET